jgi:integrase
MKSKLPTGVEELPSGRYRAVTWNRYTRKKGPSKTFDDQFAAAAFKERVELDMYRAYKAQGLDVEPPVKAITFADYVTAWTRPGPPSTVNTARSHARQMAKVWPNENLGDITPTMIKAMLLDMEVRGLSAATREGRLSTLRKIMRDAVAEGLRPDDPCTDVRGPKTSRDAGRHRNVTEAELSRILEHMPEWTHAAVLLSRDSGLRIGEVCGLPWHRLDLLHRRVSVADVVLLDGTTRGTPKGGKVLTVPLTPRTVAALRTYLERWPGGPRDRVFREPGKGHDLLKTARLRELWQKARSAAEIAYPAPRWHDLRHSRGHALARAGAPIQVIQAVLRHQNIATTRLYMGAVSASEQEQWMRAADDPGAGPRAVG